MPQSQFAVRLLVIAMVAILPRAGVAATPPLAQESRGEKALKASFYLNTVPMLVEMVGDMKKDVLDELKLDAKRRAVIEKALGEKWTEKHIYANAAAAIEKQLPPEVLDAAIGQMTPEVQAMIKAGIGEATPEQAQAWLAAARKLPDAKAREALARRIAAHMPQPDAFKELAGQVVEVMADTAQAATGTDEQREQLRSSFMEGLGPTIQAMGQKEAMVFSTIITYREHPTANMKLLADALDSDSGKKLQLAAVDSLLLGAKQTRQEIVAQLQRDLKPTKKK